MMYKKKNSDKVRIIQSKEEWMRVLQMCYSDPTMLHILRPRMTMTKVRVQQQVGGSVVAFLPLHLLWH